MKERDEKERSFPFTPSLFLSVFLSLFISFSFSFEVILERERFMTRSEWKQWKTLMLQNLSMRFVHVV
jgi:hypothetical protein